MDLLRVNAMQPIAWPGWSCIAWLSCCATSGLYSDATAGDACAESSHEYREIHCPRQRQHILLWPSVPTLVYAGYYTPQTSTTLCIDTRWRSSCAAGRTKESGARPTAPSRGIGGSALIRRNLLYHTDELDLWQPQYNKRR